MIRLIHTADWHLGQTFHGYDRDYEQRVFLEWLLHTLAERRTDVLLIAGDIFDSVNPSAAAQRRFFDFLASAHEKLPALQIVVIAGNHDAGARLEAPAGLLERLNITIIGTVLRDAAGAIDYERFVIPLKDAGGSVAALALAVPFLRPADVPEVPGATDAYLDGIREFYRCVTDAARRLRETKHPAAALVALGHCHLQGADESRDSERRIVIGGVEALQADAFSPDLAYVALGHLHRPQEFDGGRLRYSGSPIPLSFTEKDYGHRVVEVTIDASGSSSVASVLAPKTAMLLRLPSGPATPIAEVLQGLAATVFDTTLPPEAYPFLEVRVLDDGPDPTRRRKIEEALAGKPVRLALIKLELPSRAESAAATLEAATAMLPDLSTLDPEEIFHAAHFERYGAEPDQALLHAFREILAGGESTSGTATA